MSALPYQPVPTIAQRKALHADHAKRYARQYADNQPSFPEVAAAGVACCAEPEDDLREVTLPVVLGRCIAGLGTWAAVIYATWWFAPKAADLITWILEKFA